MAIKANSKPCQSVATVDYKVWQNGLQSVAGLQSGLVHMILPFCKKNQR